MPWCGYWLTTFYRLIRNILWKKQFARIRLETLQRDKDAGGLAIPKSWLYFTFHSCNRGEGVGAVCRFFSHWSGYPLKCYLLKNGGKREDRANFPTLAVMYKVWDRSVV